MNDILFSKGNGEMMLLNYFFRYFLPVLYQLIICRFIGGLRNLLKNSQIKFKEYLDLILEDCLKIRKQL